VRRRRSAAIRKDIKAIKRIDAKKPISLCRRRVNKKRLEQLSLREEGKAKVRAETLGPSVRPRSHGCGLARSYVIIISLARAKPGRSSFSIGPWRKHRASILLFPPPLPPPLRNHRTSSRRGPRSRKWTAINAAVGAARATPRVNRRGGWRGGGLLTSRPTDANTSSSRLSRRCATLMWSV
jgi:hypothetical protein